MPKKKVLFISHDASRTGAPIVLLHLLRWLKSNSDISFQVILKNDGVLEPDFAELAPTSVFNRKESNGKALLPKVAKHSGIQTIANRVRLNSLKRQLLHDDIGLIYSNTVTNGEVLRFLSDLSCPVICHVHELEYGIRCYTDQENLKRVKDYTQHYIGVSEAVTRNLLENHRIPEEKIDLVYEFIPTVSHSQDRHQDAYAQIRERLTIPKDALIVGASGTYDWWKGPDLFLQLARATYQRQLKTPVYFVWVGGENIGPRFSELQYDLKNLGLAEYVRFPGTQPNPMDYFAAADVFAMVSRVDSFPLVCLEAASLGKPIICFDGSGGAKEFIEDDCGYVVPYLDVEAMAVKAQELLTSPDLRRRFGQRAIQKVRERHDISVGATKIQKIIEQFV